VLFHQLFEQVSGFEFVLGEEEEVLRLETGGSCETTERGENSFHGLADVRCLNYICWQVK